MSLAVFVIAMLPWAKNRRKRTSFSGIALFLSGIAFLAAQISRDRVGWFYFLPVILLACFMMYLTRHGFVPNHQRRPVGMLGYILLGLTFLITPVLTVFSIILVEETRAVEVLLLITPAWLLFSGIILKIAGSEKKNLVSIKPLLFSGELSVLFSFPLFAFLAVAENSRGDKEMFYAIALGSSVIFSLCVLFRGLLGNWLCGLLFGKPEPKISMVDKENTGLPPLIATPVRKPAMFLSNYGGVVVMGGLAVLGLIGFVIGLFFDSLVDAYKASPVPVGIEPSFEGGWNGMLTAIWAPFALVLSPLSLWRYLCPLLGDPTHAQVLVWMGWPDPAGAGLAVPTGARPYHNGIHFCQTRRGCSNCPRGGGRD
jgi:hypothetical protein